jgi:hypothetical protein
VTNCPSCDKPMNYVDRQRIDIGTLGQALPGTAYTCPHCHAAISVIDHRELADLAVTIATEVARRLSGGRT